LNERIRERNARLEDVNVTADTILSRYDGK